MEALRKIRARVCNLFRKFDDMSDGYHTFGELYDYREAYNAAWFNELAKAHPEFNVYKAKRHNTGEECFGGGWFVVMADLSTGQISNHYEMKYWDDFKVKARKRAREWDGHTPKEALERIRKWNARDV